MQGCIAVRLRSHAVCAAWVYYNHRTHLPSHRIEDSAIALSLRTGPVRRRPSICCILGMISDKCMKRSNWRIYWPHMDAVLAVLFNFLPVQVWLMGNRNFAWEECYVIWCCLWIRLTERKWCTQVSQLPWAFVCTLSHSWDVGEAPALRLPGATYNRDGRTLNAYPLVEEHLRRLFVTPSAWESLVHYCYILPCHFHCLSWSSHAWTFCVERMVCQWVLLFPSWRDMGCLLSKQPCMSMSQLALLCDSKKVHSSNCNHRHPR